MYRKGHAIKNQANTQKRLWEVGHVVNFKRESEKDYGTTGPHPPFYPVFKQLRRR